jgi:flagellar M-ring protein FliF
LNAFFQNALRQIREFFAKLNRGEKIRLGVLAALILGFSITLALILSRVNYDVLYTNLPPEEAGQILAALEEMDVPVKTLGSDTIMAPSERVGELRMRLEAEGFNTGELPTDLIDRATGIASTAQDRDTFNRLQLQTYLRTGIKRMDKISDCLVLLNVQQDSIFALNPNKTPSSASVLLETTGGQGLSSSEAYSVGQFVSMTVPGLELENIRIVDSQMRLYNLEAALNPEGSGGADIDYQVALRERIRESIEKQVINLLSPVFGQGHVQASVNATLNFDKETVSSVVFAPPVEGETSGIVVSMKELYESSREADGVQGVPGTDTNGLGVVEYPYGTLGPDQYYSQVLREMNYEINETRSEVERAQGAIRDLSIAVIIDSESVADDYTENVRNLVAQAVGVANRYVSVERLPIKAAEVPDGLWQEQRDFELAMKNRELIKTVIIFLTVLLLVLLIIFFLRALFAPRHQLALAGGQVIDYFSPEEGLLQDLAALSAGDAAEDAAEEHKIITVKPESLEQLEKFIERDPQAVAQLLRNWLEDEY